MKELNGLRGKRSEEQEQLIAPALPLLVHLHRTFEPTRKELLAARETRKEWGPPADSPPETSAIRLGTWQVAGGAAGGVAGGATLLPATADSLPADSLPGASPAGIPLIASLEDPLPPSLDRLIDGQRALQARAAAGVPLFVEPRGWHLPEAHIVIDDEELSATLFDFGLYMVLNGSALRAAGLAPSFLLPKIEHYLEARLWSNLLVQTESILDLPLGSIRCILAIESEAASFESEELLFELRDHVAAISFDPVDFLFRFVKDHQGEDPLPFWQSDAAAAHHAAAVARAAASAARRGVPVLPPPAVTGGPSFPADSVSTAIHLALGALAAWIRQDRAGEIDGRPRSIAIAELCRAQLWQWRRRKATLADGTVVSGTLLNSAIQRELAARKEQVGDAAVQEGKYREAATILLDLLLSSDLPDYLTIPCYRKFLAD